MLLLAETDEALSFSSLTQKIRSCDWANKKTARDECIHRIPIKLQMNQTLQVKPDPQQAKGRKMICPEFSATIWTQGKQKSKRHDHPTS